MMGELFANRVFFHHQPSEPTYFQCEMSIPKISHMFFIHACAMPSMRPTRWKGLGLHSGL